MYCITHTRVRRRRLRRGRGWGTPLGATLGRGYIYYVYVGVLGRRSISDRHPPLLCLVFVPLSFLLRVRNARGANVNFSLLKIFPYCEKFSIRLLPSSALRLRSLLLKKSSFNSLRSNLNVLKDT